MDKSKYVLEYIKCKEDPIYFIKTYVMIELGGGDVPFQLYDKQQELIEHILKYHNLCVLKSRQTGISTTVQALVCWLVVFHNNLRVGVLSKDLPEATSFARFIRSMVEKLPIWMRPEFSKYTEQTFSLANGSTVISKSVNPNEPTKTLRGKSLHYLIVDESAFINHLDIAWESLVPAISTAQKNARDAGIPYGIVVVSTPNKTTGMGAWFFQIHQQAIKNSEGDVRSVGTFRSFIVHWKDIRELVDDPTWYEAQCNLFNHDQRKIAQELELIFLPSSGSFLDEMTCLSLQNTTLDSKPERIWKLFGGEIWEFQKPIDGHLYLIGVDTARGNAGDFSTITVHDYVTLDQVWEFQGKCDVTDFCKVVDFVCAQYPGLVIPENNSYGNQVSEFIDRGAHMDMLYKHRRGDSQVIRGLTTDIRTRPLMIEALESHLRHQPSMIKSKRMALELIGLVEKNGKVQADVGGNDDLALALSFLCYVRKYDPPLSMDIQSSKWNTQDFGNILGMNFDSPSLEIKSLLEGGREIDLASANARLLKIAKEKVTTSDDTFFNITSLIQ